VGRADWSADVTVNVEFRLCEGMLIGVVLGVLMLSG
jgi:hypothetical protein